MKRYLAIDYGTKRVGLAVTDPLKITCQPLPALPNDKQLIPALAQIIQEKNVEKIILGHPIQLNGQVGIAAQKIQSFAQELKKCNINVVLFDERLTTAQAEKVLLGLDMSRQKRKANIDSLAAALLLEDYLKGEQHAQK